MKPILIGFLTILMTLFVSVSPAVVIGRRRPVARGAGLGLAFAGGYVAGSTRRNYYNNNYYYNSPDYYGYPQNSGCYNCYYGKKRRRSVPEGLNRTQIEDMFKEISQADVDKCGFFLLCELAEKPIPELEKLELTILAPFTGDSQSDGTYYGNYNEAVWRGKNEETCSEVYPTCESNTEDILENIRQQREEYIAEMEKQEEGVTESIEPSTDSNTDEQ